MDRGHDPTAAVGVVSPDVIPGAHWQACAEARAALSLLDRVFPPEQCRHDPDDVWAPGDPPPRTPRSIP